MMFANLTWQAPALAVVAWLATFVIHSTVLLAIAYLVQRRFASRPEIVDVVWKTAIVASLVSASVQTALGVDPAGGRISVAAAPEAIDLASDALPPAVRPSGVVTPGGAAYDAVPAADGVLQVGPAPHGREDDRDDDVGITARVSTPVARDADTASVAIVAGPTATMPRPPHDPGSTTTTVSRPSLPDRGAPAPTIETATAATGAWAWLALAWLLVAASGLVGLARAWWRLRVALRACVPAPASCTRMLAELQRGGTPVRLSLSPAINVPIATGVFTPHIVVPPRVLELSEDAQRTMLAHELAHTRRRDPAWRLLLAVLERALFVQPLLRLARSGLEQSAEYLCDRWAAARTEAPIELARCLTEIATWTPPVRMGLAATLPEPQSILGRRVVRLLETAAPTSPRVHLRSLLAMSAAGAALVVLAPTVSSARDPEPAAAPSFGEVPPMLFVRGRVPDAPPLPVVVVRADAEVDGDTASTPKERRSTRRRLRRAMAQARREHRDVELEALARALGRSDATPEALMFVLDERGVTVTLDPAAIEALHLGKAELAAARARMAEVARDGHIAAARPHAAADRARAAAERRRAIEDLARAKAHAARARHDQRHAPIAPPAPPAPPAWIEIDAPDAPAWIEIDAPDVPEWIEIDAPDVPAWIEIDAPDAPDVPAWIEFVAPAPPAPPDAPSPPSPPSWVGAPEAPPAPPAPPARAPRAPRPPRRVALQ